MSEKAKCPHCGRDVAVYTPTGGDGSLVRFRAHNVSPMQPCPNSKRDVS